jgi:hypothetical protein
MRPTPDITELLVSLPSCSDRVTLPIMPEDSEGPFHGTERMGKATGQIRCQTTIMVTLVRFS